MGRQTVLEADLDFSVDLPGDRLVTGRLTGSGSRLDLSVSDPFVFAGRGDSTAIGHLADALASRGLSVTVTSPAGPLVTLGAARTPWWQRRVTGSRHIRIERGAGLWALARGRVRAAPSALPSSDLAPPATLWPPAPTLVRRPRRVTTTHDPLGGGNPRMIMAPRSDPWPGDRQQVFGLRKDVTSIGSDAGCDIQLPGLDPRHAEIRHDERDEYVVVGLGRLGETLVNGEPVESSLLRTATRLQVGDWTMSFYREEYADHGRPYGGRVGGEIGHQRPQPPPRHRPASSWSQGERR